MLGNVTERERGCVGTPAMTDSEAAVVLTIPAPLVDFTVNVYAVPLVKPLTVQERCVAVAVHVLLTLPTLGDAVTR